MQVPDTSGAEYEIAFLAKSFLIQNQIYTRDTEPPVMDHSNNPVPQLLVAYLEIGTSYVDSAADTIYHDISRNRYTSVY